MRTTAAHRQAAVLLTAVLLVTGCGPRPDAPRPAPDVRTVSVTFEHVGGCQVSPNGCERWETRIDRRADAAAADVLLDADLAALAPQPTNPATCGSAPVDGVGVLATVTRDHWPDPAAFEQVTLCLSDADATLPSIETLWQLHDRR